MNDLEPNIPASLDRSASRSSGKNRLTTALLLSMFSFPAVSTAAETSLPQLSLEVRGHRASGAYFLVSQPFSRVKSELQKNLAAKPALKGFKASDESAPLSHMEYCWSDIALSRHPEVRVALNQQIKEKSAATFTAALTAGVITAEERTRFEQAIAQQRGYNKEAITGAPFFSQRITRWSYQRRRGTSERYNDDYVTIMDVSPLLGRAPVTLVWISGTLTEITSQGRGRNRSISKSTYDLLFPSWPDRLQPDKRLITVLRFVEGMAKRMPALSNEDTRDAMRGLSSDEREIAAAESVDITTAPTVDVQGFDLPADEDHIRPAPNLIRRCSLDYRATWRMLALPDGSILASGLASHRFVQREAEVERLDAMPGMQAVDDLKIDPTGTVWGHGVTSDGARFFQSWSPVSNSGETYQVCSPNRASALPLELTEDQISRTCAPRYPDNWIVQPGRGIAFSAGAELFALGEEKKWTHATWDEKLRRAVSDALDQFITHARNNIIRFGDGLFWLADHDGYGIDPITARVARTVATSHRGVFFGSLSAGWGLGLPSDVYWFEYLTTVVGGHDYHFPIVDLASGKPRLDVQIGDLLQFSIARSAHGRLLAISNGSYPRGLAIVLDMKDSKPLATLRAPEDYLIDAMAFSWQGDKLWLYARKAGDSGERKMIVWDVPTGLADAAQGVDVPDQLTLGVETISGIGCF